MELEKRSYLFGIWLGCVCLKSHGRRTAVQRRYLVLKHLVGRERCRPIVSRNCIRPHYLRRLVHLGSLLLSPGGAGRKTKYGTATQANALMTFPPKSVVLPEKITTERGDGGKGSRKEKAPRDGGAQVDREKI